MSNNQIVIQKALSDAISDYDRESPRTKQSRAGVLGPSDIGFCRQKATLVTRGTDPSDERSTAAAQIGTAIHAHLAEVFRWANPDNWIVEGGGERLTATLPSGVEISGTPDLILTDWNALIDVKTVDGFAWVKREGTSQNHKFQRHLYALAAVQNGLLKEDGLLVGNLYIDRSGKEAEPLLLLSDYDPTLTDEIDSWIGDVIYAVKNDEDAMRDIPAPVCEQICEFFTVCRGGLETHEGGEFIEDDGLKAALRMYVEGREMAKEGESMKRAASSRLHGVNGTDGEWQVRWTSVSSSRIEAYERDGYEKIDVRKARRT